MPLMTRWGPTLATLRTRSTPHGSNASSENPEHCILGRERWWSVSRSAGSGCARTSSGAHRWYLWLLRVVIPGSQQERTQGREHRLLWWETGAACERRYRDHDHWHNLRPDAFAEYQAGERRVRFWLEWDRATMGTRDLAAKFRTYAQYVASREWFKQEAALPLLLVVTPDSGQERRLGRVVTATLTDNCGLIIRTTTLTRVRQQGILGPIWNQVFPQSEGTNPMPRRMFNC